MAEDIIERTPLPEGYYLHNFLKLLDFVNERYDDMLIENEKQFYKTFTKLSEGAQRLYVRLVTRKGPYFRLDKVAYAEIPELDQAVDELELAGFFAVNPRLALPLALHTITKPELVDFLKDVPELSEFVNLSASKQQLVAEIASLEEAQVWALLEKRFTFLLPLYQETVEIYRLLFFGNLEQELSEFILEDIGVLRYEPYEIRDEDRFFQQRQVVEDLHAFTYANAELWDGLQSNHLEKVMAIGNWMLEQDPHDKLKGKYRRSFCHIGRFLEKFKLWEEALGFYQHSGLHPARERTVRVWEKTGREEASLVLLAEILENPFNEDEAEFAAMFAEKVKKKVGQPYQKQKRETFPTVSKSLEKEEGLNVEAIALNSYQQDGYEGFYAENLLWGGLFGLLFWDIIFMPIPNVFFNPFQRGPKDLFSENFREKRTEQIKKRLVEVASNNQLSVTIRQCYEEKFNTANYFVSWKRADLEQFVKIVEWVPREHLVAILSRMADNLREFRSGFPDLMLFGKEKGDYLLAEVKGPGDQLRPNQKRWFRFFQEIGIPYNVTKVSWADG
ncbi:VRR-NUC domain-containing protein [Limibacter armeniacum]|uniref:VRR-NUC domain-containing protein n=1 Tax=Limibacter armeniacum TaxID=466084 RepID=UPI002FE5FEBB